jgi:hypothetical protein
VQFADEEILLEDQPSYAHGGRYLASHREVISPSSMQQDGRGPEGGPVLAHSIVELLRKHAKGGPTVHTCGSSPATLEDYSHVAGHAVAIVGVHAYGLWRDHGPGW